ncbi:MAG: hypothetical protein ABIT16_04905 [Croceibacterium sp.]
MKYWRRVSPKGAISDLVNEWRAPNPYRWQVLGVSVAATFALMMLFIPESQTAEPRKPKITYISTFAPGRSDAEIKATNLENQKLQDVRHAEEAAAEERVKAGYRALGRATGIDVDAMEADIARKRAAEEAAKARRAVPLATPPSAAPSAQ